MSLVMLALGVWFGGSTVARPAAQEATPTTPRPDLANSWRVVANLADGRTLLTLSTFGADGTVVASGLPAQQTSPGVSPPSGLVFLRAGHGAWEAADAEAATVSPSSTYGRVRRGKTTGP
jgi:hypothetical protein